VRERERLLSHIRCNIVTLSHRKGPLLLLRVIITVLRSYVRSRASESIRVFGINSVKLAVKAIIRLSNVNPAQASKANRGNPLRGR
jgi:hypothetical protein